MKFAWMLVLAASIAFSASLAATEVGGQGPNYKFKKSWNTPAGFDELDDYRGKLVLVERWATWCGPCMAMIPHLTDLNKKYRDRGFEICSTSDEDTGTIQSKMIDAKKPEYGIIACDISGLYQTDGIPHAWVLNAEGKCLWKGHPSGLSDAMIDEWLKDLAPSKVGKELNKELNSAVKAFDKGEIGKAMAEAKKVADTAPDEAVKADCEFLLGQCNKHVALFENKMKAAGTDLAAKVKVMEEGATKLKGSEIGEKWDAEAKELKKSDAYAASEALAKIKPTLKDLRPGTARKKLEAIAKKYPDTDAGKEAAELAREYQD